MTCLGNPCFNLFVLLAGSTFLTGFPNNPRGFTWTGRYVHARV